MADRCPQCGLPLLQCRCANLDIEELARHLFAQERVVPSFDEFGFDVLLPYYARAASIIAMAGSLQ